MSEILRPIGYGLPGYSEKITEHFSWKELLVSSLCPEEIKAVVLSGADQVNYFHLIATVLEPERRYSNISTVIVQGKRSLEMYDALLKAGYSPSSTSQHFCDSEYDCAIDFQKISRDKNGDVDIEASRVATYSAFIWIQARCKTAFGQMYFSSPKNEEQIGFIHIGSLTPSKQNQVWER